MHKIFSQYPFGRLESYSRVKTIYVDENFDFQFLRFPDKIEQKSQFISFDGNYRNT